MNRKQKRLKDRLMEIVRNEPNSLRSEVAQEALDYGSEIETFFHDLLTHGCQIGMVGKLIYYRDTHAFYDKYYEEIESLRMALEEECGERLQIQGDLKNWFAWMAFEETTRVIACELNFKY